MSIKERKEKMTKLTLIHQSKILLKNKLHLRSSNFKRNNYKHLQITSYLVIIQNHGTVVFILKNSIRKHKGRYSMHFLLTLWFIISWAHIILSWTYLSDYYLSNKMNSKLKLSTSCCKNNPDTNIIMLWLLWQWSLWPF